MVLLRKSIPQNRDLKAAAELNVNDRNKPEHGTKAEDRIIYIIFNPHVRTVL